MSKINLSQSMKTKQILLTGLIILSLTACSNQQTSTSASTDQKSNTPTNKTEPYNNTENNNSNSMNKTTSSTTNSSNISETKEKIDQLAKPEKGDTVAIMETDFGTIKFKIFTKEVPEISKNFIELAKQGK